MSESADSFPELRPSDADREQVVEVLRRATSRGQLMTAELEERIALAYAASTRSDLERLTADVSDAARASTEPPDPGFKVREGHAGSRWVVSILGGHDKRGPGGSRPTPRCSTSWAAARST